MYTSKCLSSLVNLVNKINYTGELETRLFLVQLLQPHYDMISVYGSHIRPMLGATAIYPMKYAHGYELSCVVLDVGIMPYIHPYCLELLNWHRVPKGNEISEGCYEHSLGFYSLQDAIVRVYESPL